MPSLFPHKRIVAGVVLCAELLMGGCTGRPETSSPTGVSVENHAPTIAGHPGRQTGVGSTYAFTPSANDRDGDSLTFAAASVPVWATFDRATGRLAGTPAMIHVGLYSNIVITVSDGRSTATLPAFEIRVASAATGRKSNPGHYIALNRHDTETNVLEAAQQAGVRGIQKRYYWRELEPAFDSYDFSAVLADLELVESQGKMLVVFVEDKTFNGELPTPAYLQPDLTAENRNGGFTSIRWDPHVVTRFSRLLQALGQSIDSHPALEGVAIQESSLGLDDATLETFDYSPENYRDALIEVLTSAARSFPSSQVFWYMNYLAQEQSYLQEIATAVAPHGIAMGGPDVLPDSEPLERLTYPLYDQFESRMTMFNSMQYHSYGHRHADASYATLYWTMDELFEFARDDLHVNYLFWTRKSFRDPADSYMWFDALPVIQENPAFNE